MWIDQCSALDIFNNTVYEAGLGIRIDVGSVTLKNNVFMQCDSVLDDNTREVDKVFRYGGDEFCVILPETDSTDAVVVADKVRSAVSEYPFPGLEKMPEKEITVSVGVATFPRDTDEAEDLINKADQALYTAKQEGRNSVAAAG